MQKVSAERLILDAWALLALIQGEEPAASKVLKAINDAERKEVSLHMSWINLGEVYYQIGKKAMLSRVQTWKRSCCCRSSFMKSRNRMCREPPKTK